MRVKIEDESKIQACPASWSMKKLRKYKDEFGLDDSQDLLAMVAFDMHGGSLLETKEINAGIAKQLKSSYSSYSMLVKSAVIITTYFH